MMELLLPAARVAELGFGADYKPRNDLHHDTRDGLGYSDSR